MKKTFFLFVLYAFAFSVAFSQNDFIVLKKNHHTIKTFFTGVQISFTTPSRYFSGQINSIFHDSIFLLEYDIRQTPTNLGVYMLDTVATYRTGVSYKDILKIQNKKKGFDLAASGGSLLGGGILLTTIGLGTWIFAKPGDQYHASPKLVIGSALLGAGGYVLLKLKGEGYTIGKKYQLHYISTK